jgi:hypothetical protein
LRPDEVPPPAEPKQRTWIVLQLAYRGTQQLKASIFATVGIGVAVVTGGSSVQF